jgi:hypothetical protein
MGVFMKCCDERNLYVESNPKVHKEQYGEFIVMCGKCGWSDKYVFMKKELAESRMVELLSESIADCIKKLQNIEISEDKPINNDVMIGGIIKENKPIDLRYNLLNGGPFPISADCTNQTDLPESSVKAMLDAENLQFGR